MAVFDNMNYSYSNGVAPGIIDYYERTLLENAKPEMVHARDAQKRTLPANNGKRVQFRRMTPFGAVTAPLTEGVTPAGQTLTQTALWAMVKPYGAHVELTDELDMYHLDNMHRETATLLSDQAALTLDTIERDAMNSGLNVQYTGNNTARSTISASDKLTAADIKKAVRTLKRNNCKPFADGFYHAIVHPDTIFDLTGDPQWVDIAKYQDKSKVEKYELGCLYKVKFFESTNAKIFDGNGYVYGTTASLTVTSLATDKLSVSYSASLTADQVREMTGKLLKIQGATSGAADICIDRIDETAKKIYFRWPMNATLSGSMSIVPGGAGASNAPVYSTVVYGQNAYGDVELAGNGKNVEIIMKPNGSSGALDPLNQRGTVAWKVKGYCCTILQDAFIVRIEHGATA